MHLKDIDLEVISPFFDSSEECHPLTEILRRFRPRETRVFLPRGAGGLWLAANTMAGPVAAFGFGLLAVLWLGTTGWGISLAMRGDRVAHLPANYF